MPACRAATLLAEFIQGGRVAWQATPAMRKELERVLTYQHIAALCPERWQIEAAWQQWAIEPAREPEQAGLRCGDPDDQKFIDLALAGNVRWLLSKDREVLKLAARARAFGVQICTLATWRP